MANWTIHLNPETMAPEVVDGALVTTTEVLSNAFHAVCTDSGTVEGLPTFGGGLLSVTHVNPHTLNQLAGRVDAGMASMPLGGWDSYRRKVYYAEDGIPQVEVRLNVEGEEDPEVLTLPLPV